MLGVIAILIFLTISLFILGIHSVATSKVRLVDDRIKEYTSLAKHGVDNMNSGVISKFSSKEILRKLGKMFATRGFTQKLQDELSKAEIPMKGEEFAALVIIICSISAFIGAVVSKELLAVIVFPLAVLGGSKLLIINRKNKRLIKINLQLGDCLTILGNSLRAGYSFQQALELASREMVGPLATEFRRTIREIGLGITIEKALENLDNRVGSGDLSLIVTAVNIQRQTGGNLAEILDNISETIRERLRIKNEIRTLTAQGRMSGMVIGILPVALFVILMIINPAYMGLLIKTHQGLIILGVAIVSELLGAIMIRNIINIDV